MAAAASGSMLQIQVRNWIQIKGYGFGMWQGCKVFLHRSCGKAGLYDLSAGQVVWCKVVQDLGKNAGKFKAVEMWSAEAWEEKQRQEVAAEELERAAAGGSKRAK